jgi:hypothetical protein
METVRIRDPGWKKVGSGTNIPDPQYWQILIKGLRLDWSEQCGGSRIRIFSIPYPGSGANKISLIPIRMRIKEFKYFNQKKWGF